MPKNAPKQSANEIELNRINEWFKTSMRKIEDREAPADKFLQLAYIEKTRGCPR